VSSAFLLAFVVGLLSALHCIGMCGGVVGTLSFSLPARTPRGGPSFVLYQLAYNAGRVISYALVGAIFGMLGEALIAGGAHVWLQDALRWLAAVVVVGIGLYIAGWFPRFTRIERIGEPVWRWLEPVGRRLLPVTSLSRALLFGAVWGWLPCGLVYTMLLSAPAQGDPVSGALYMALFGLGTLPVMLVTGLFAGRLYRFAGDSRLKVVSGLAVVFLGLFALVLQGYNQMLF
jgi:sulfite exporter TauE/SafE